MAPARLPGLPSPVQAAAQNLALSERDDRFEHEAERVARQVMGMVSQVPDTVNPDKPGRQAGAGQPIQRQEARPDKEPEDTTQHQEEDALGTSKYIEESAAQAKQQPVGPMLVQLKANDVGAADLPGHIEQAIVEARGQGRPLPPRAMGQMERAFGADFSAVRIHDDDRADMLAREIDAKAFTNGKEIFFRDGEYNPGSMDGQQLIAHELAHVVQQGAGSVDAPQRRGDPHKELVQRR
ncbi:MAG: DUF4157 domain-containing protein [Anaerolineae bacterium]|nr:DUF4157 domain-containing protein [Anaerolineae bacterium]